MYYYQFVIIIIHAFTFPVAVLTSSMILNLNILRMLKPYDQSKILLAIMFSHPQKKPLNQPNKESVQVFTSLYQNDTEIHR